jgi:DNA-binding MarR family transcriptional regulator
MGASARADVAVSRDQLDQVVEGTRLVGGLIAESLANLRPTITAAQWRVLVLTSQATCNVSAVAEDLRVHMSNATRICDRLVEAGLLERRRAEHDRRQVLLALTPQGRELFGRTMDYRRRHLADAMARMTEDDRAALAHSLTRLVEASTAVRTARGSEA